MQIAHGQQDFALARGKVRMLPLEAALSATIPAGQINYSTVTLRTITQLNNPAIPTDSPRRVHNTYTPLGGAVIALHRVEPSVLTVRARRAGNLIKVGGRLSAHERVMITVDLITARGRTTHTIRSDTQGRYTTSFEMPARLNVVLHALWLGDQNHAHALSQSLKLAPVSH